MKVAQIGVGGWGKNHVRVLSQLNALVAICDLDKVRVKELGEKYEVNYYSELRKMLTNEEFDACIICTPTSTHFTIASTLIEEGKHVFIEKPMTYTSDEGQKLVKLAQDKGVLLTCGYIERFNPAVSYVKERIMSKEYGELLMVEFHRENRMPLHIKDVGIIYDTSVHDIDTALWLFEEKPENVYARSGKHLGDHEDFANIVLGFKNNRTAIISSNWITPSKVRKFNAVFTDARIDSDFITQEVKIDMADGSFIPRKKIEEPLFLEIKNFVDAVYNGGELRVKPEDALFVTKIAEAAIESTKTGKPVPI